jgi:integrase
MEHAPHRYQETAPFSVSRSLPQGRSVEDRPFPSPTFTLRKRPSRFALGAIRNPLLYRAGHPRPCSLRRSFSSSVVRGQAPRQEAPSRRFRQAQCCDNRSVPRLLRGPIYGTVPPTRPTVDGIRRSQVSLSSCAPFEEFTTTLLYPLRRPTVSLSGNDLWVEPCSSYLVRHSRLSSRPPSRARPSPALLHGRHYIGRSVQEVGQVSHHHAHIIPQRLRSRNQPREVRSLPYQTTSPPRFYYRLRKLHLCRTERKSARHSRLLSNGSASSSPSNPDRHVPFRQAHGVAHRFHSHAEVHLVSHSRINSSHSSPPSASSSASSPSYHPVLRRQRGPQLDSPQSALLSSRLLRSSSQSSSLHRRKHPRLGRILSPTSVRLSRPLAAAVSTPTHTDPGTLCSPPRRRRSSYPTRITHRSAYRQHLRPVLPNTLGRQSLSGAPSTVSLPVGQAPRSQHHTSLHSLHSLTSQHIRRPAVAYFLNSALAPNSTRFYSTTWSRYCAYASRFGAPAVPPQTHIIDAFLCDIARHPPDARAVLRIVSVLKHGFAYNDIAWQPSPRSSLIIRGIAKTAPPADPLLRDPFLPCHLQLLLARLDLSLYEDLHLATLAALSLYLALRPAEVVTLRRSDLTRSSPDSFSIRFLRKKTRYAPVFETRSIASPIVIDLLNRYLAALPASASPYLFSLHDSSAVNAWAVRISFLIGIPHLHGHSFRIGCATSLSLSGFPSLEIKVWGDWRSRAYLRYVRAGRRHDFSHDPIGFFPSLHDPR